MQACIVCCNACIYPIWAHTLDTDERTFVAYGLWDMDMAAGKKEGEGTSRDRKHKADKEQHVGRHRQKGEGERGRQCEAEKGYKKWITFHFGN